MTSLQSAVNLFWQYSVAVKPANKKVNLLTFATTVGEVNGLHLRP